MPGVGERQVWVIVNSPAAFTATCGSEGVAFAITHDLDLVLVGEDQWPIVADSSGNVGVCTVQLTSTALLYKVCTQLQCLVLYCVSIMTECTHSTPLPL